MNKKTFNSAYYFSLCLGCFVAGTLQPNAQVCETSVVVCNNDINITLDENCFAQILPDMVLEGMECENDFYSVEVFDENGYALGDVVGADEAGQSVTIQVIHLASGNMCWGTGFVEDKLAPEVNCPCTDTPEDCAFLCTDLDMLLVGGGPVASATDACGVPEVSFSDEVETTACNGITITRTFIATDNSGNTGICEQDIFLRPLDLNDVMIETQIELPCEFYNNTHPDSLAAAGIPGAYPYVESEAGIFELKLTLCNLGVTYIDGPPTSYCGNTFQFFRTWSVFDWCNAQAINFTQLIQSYDNDPPVIHTCPDYGTAIPVGPYPDECIGVFPVQPLTDFSENCSAPASVEVILFLEDGTQSLVGVGEYVQAVAGTHQLVYSVTDDCGNVASCTAPVVVEDLAPPVLICDEHTAIALGSDGNGEICADTFDDFSYDNCGYIVMKLKRMDAPATEQFADCLNFSCEDIQFDSDGNPVPVFVRVRAYDIIPDAGFPDEEDAGRWNECMVQVEVQDKLFPIINCPPDKTVECQTVFVELDQVIPDDDGVVDDDPLYPPVFYQNENQFQGYYPNAVDNCNATILVVDEGGIVGNCGEGFITRTWTITDAAGQFSFCTQLITIENSSPFDGDDIGWPDNATTDCATGTSPQDLPADSQEPVFTEDACDLIEVIFEDDYFPVVDSACYKIFRYWTVYDWCQFDDLLTPNPGVWTHTQVIEVMDNNAPEIVSPLPDVTLCSYENDCLEPVVFDLVATDLCSDNLLYTLSVPGVYSGAFVPGDSLNIPAGEHIVTWSVDDGCNNSTSTSFQLTILDCKQPTPVCIDGLASVLMPQSLELTLWATDFNLAGTSGSFDNCTAQENLEFRIRKVYPYNSLITILPQVLALDSSVVFTCDDLGTSYVELYVLDEAGNFDFCTTSVNIVDNSGLCPSEVTTGIIHGFIETELNDRVENVMVRLTGGGAEIDQQMTDGAGEFEFEALLDQNYSVVPEHNENPLNGVTTYDLVLIGRHILGVDTLDSPYKIIAADANRSNGVTTLDLVYLRKLILNIDTEFTNNTSWRFIDKIFDFPDPLDPFLTFIPESIPYNNLEINPDDANFIAVKVGDVNNSAIPNLLLRTENRKEAEPLVFNLQDQKLNAGEFYNIAFTAKDFKAISGFQFTLEYDNSLVEITETSTGKLPEFSKQNFGLNPKGKAAITCSWHNINNQSLSENTPVFFIGVQTKVETSLQNVFKISSALAPAEAYRDDESANVRLAFLPIKNIAIDEAGFVLYQSYPNPFSTETAISFYLPEKEAVTLSVFNQYGSKLLEKTTFFSKGKNNFILTKQEIGQDGVLYYNVSTDKNSRTGKVILLK